MTTNANPDGTYHYVGNNRAEQAALEGLPMDVALAILSGDNERATALLTAEAEHAICDYRAIRRDGSHEVGVRPTENIADWVEGRFRAGWRKLDVNDRAGECVGQIFWTDQRRPKRTWWALGDEQRS